MELENQQEIPDDLEEPTTDKQKITGETENGSEEGKLTAIAPIPEQTQTDEFGDFTQKVNSSKENIIDEEFEDFEEPKLSLNDEISDEFQDFNDKNEQEFEDFGAGNDFDDFESANQDFGDFNANSDTSSSPFQDILDQVQHLQVQIHDEVLERKISTMVDFATMDLPQHFKTAVEKLFVLPKLELNPLKSYSPPELQHFEFDYESSQIKKRFLECIFPEKAEKSENMEEIGDAEESGEFDLALANDLLALSIPDLQSKSKDELHLLVNKLNNTLLKIQEQTNHWMDQKAQLAMDAEMHNKMIASLVSYAQQQQKKK